jgi:hypothetical protein
MPQFLSDPQFWREFLISGGLIATVVALIAGVYEALKTIRAWINRRRERKSLFRLFVIEAVWLHDAWIQFHGQSDGRTLSFRQPYQCTSDEHLRDYINLGGSDAIVSALYAVKAANLDIMTQVKWGQQIQIEGLIAGRDQIDVSSKTFSRAKAFLIGHWDRVTTAITLLLEEADRQSLKVADLKALFSQNVAKGKPKADDLPEKK